MFGHVPQKAELPLADAAEDWEEDERPLHWLVSPTPPDGNTPDNVRISLHNVLAYVRAAEVMPWDAEALRFYSGLVPYMAEWLKGGEGDALMAEIKAELDRLEAPADQVAPNWRRIWGIAA